MAQPDFQNIVVFGEVIDVSIQSNLYFWARLTGLISLADIAFMFFDKQNRTLHDRIGATYVIRRHGL